MVWALACVASVGGIVVSDLADSRGQSDRGPPVSGGASGAEGGTQRGVQYGRTPPRKTFSARPRCGRQVAAGPALSTLQSGMEQQLVAPVRGLPLCGPSSRRQKASRS